MTKPITRSPVGELVDHLFRHQAGQITAALTCRLGAHQIDLVEDIVQEALIRALRSWPHRGVPDNPAGWLMQTATHVLIDTVRRQKSFSAKQSGIIAALESSQSDYSDHIAAYAQEISDDLLVMMFAACHPSLSLESSVSFTLKVLCGFSTREIAQAFLAEEATIAQRITRAKRHFRNSNIALESPTPSELPSRLDAVLAVLYLMFNEGYNRHSGDHLISAELCHEAIRLTRLLVENPRTDRPEVHAVMALFCFHASRLPARTDATGDLLLLQYQDRTKWDRDLLAEGVRHLELAAQGQEVTRYHLEAGIASLHGIAATFADTDWSAMKFLYDELASIDQSPVVLLNRAVVISMIDGPSAALAELEGINETTAVERLHLYYSTRGELHFRLGHFETAEADFRRAIAAVGNETERRFLQRRIDDCLTISAQRSSS